MLVTVPLVTAVRRWAPKRASVPFHAVYGVVFVFYLHGVRTAWIAALALTHFGVCRALAGIPGVGSVASWRGLPQQYCEQYTKPDRNYRGPG